MPAGDVFLYPLGKSTGKLCGETSPKASFPQGSNPSFSANDYKHCSFVISDKHLKLQWIKGLKRLCFKPFSCLWIFCNTLAKLLNRTFCNRTKPYRTCIFGDPFGDPLKLDKIGFGVVYTVLLTFRSCQNLSLRCRSSFSGNSSHQASILLAVHKVFTFASEELQKATSSGIKILSEIGAACLSDSAAPCLCPKPAPRPRKSVLAFQRASIQRPHVQLVGMQRRSNRLQRPLPPPKLSRRSWIYG